MVTHRECFALVLRSDCNMINNIKVTFRQYTCLGSRTRSIHLHGMCFYFFYFSHHCILLYFWFIFHTSKIMNTNYKTRRENESNEMYDKSSDSDSDTAINICPRKKAISIWRKNVLSTSESESEDDYVEDALPTSSNNIQWAMENVQLRFHNFNNRDISFSGRKNCSEQYLEFNSLLHRRIFYF